MPLIPEAKAELEAAMKIFKEDSHTRMLKDIHTRTSGEPPANDPPKPPKTSPTPPPVTEPPPNPPKRRSSIWAVGSDDDD